MEPGVRSLFSGSSSPLAIAGSALFWLWMDAAVFSDTLCASGSPAAAYQIAFFAITVGTVAGMLFAPRLLRGLIFTRGHLAEAGVFAGCGLVGSALIACAQAVPGLGYAPLIAGSLLAAAFFSFYNVLWGLVCVAQGHAKALVHIAASWSLGLPFNLLLGVLPPEVATTAVVALPALTGVAYGVLHARQASPSFHVEQEQFPRQDILPRRGVVAGVDVRLLLLTLAFCTVFGFMYMNQVVSGSYGEDALDMGPLVVGARGCAALVFFAAGLTVLRDRVALLFRICFLALVAGFAVVVFSMFVPSLAGAGGVMIAVGYCGFDVLVWVMIAFHGYVSSNQPARTIGITMFAEQLGICVGAAAGAALSLLAIDGTAEAIVLMVLELLAIVVLTVYTEYGSRLWTLLLKTPMWASDGKLAAPVPESDDRLDALARRFGLTERETQVVALLMQGRSMGYIADKVCVSENTVKTHVRHIYTKCGIHNKQELLDLVEGLG